jgi:hypothetical protein
VAGAYKELKKQYYTLMKRELKRDCKKDGKREKKRRYYSDSSNFSDNDSE